MPLNLLNKNRNVLKKPFSVIFFTKNSVKIPFLERAAFSNPVESDILEINSLILKFWRRDVWNYNMCNFEGFFVVKLIVNKKEFSSVPFSRYFFFCKIKKKHLLLRPGGVLKPPPKQSDDLSFHSELTISSKLCNFLMYFLIILWFNNLFQTLQFILSCVHLLPRDQRLSFTAGV